MTWTLAGDVYSDRALTPQVVVRGGSNSCSRPMPRESNMWHFIITNQNFHSSRWMDRTLVQTASRIHIYDPSLKILENVLVPCTAPGSIWLLIQETDQAENGVPLTYTFSPFPAPKFALSPCGWRFIFHPTTLFSQTKLRKPLTAVFTRPGMSLTSLRTTLDPFLFHSWDLTSTRDVSSYEPFRRGIALIVIYSVQVNLDRR